MEDRSAVLTRTRRLLLCLLIHDFWIANYGSIWIERLWPFWVLHSASQVLFSYARFYHCSSQSKKRRKISQDRKERKKEGRKTDLDFFFVLAVSLTAADLTAPVSYADDWKRAERACCESISIAEQTLLKEKTIQMERLVLYLRRSRQQWQPWCAFVNTEGV